MGSFLLWGIRTRVTHKKMSAQRASLVEIYAGDWLPFESPMSAEAFDFRVFNLFLEKKKVCESTSLDF